MILICDMRFLNVNNIWIFININGKTWYKLIFKLIK